MMLRIIATLFTFAVLANSISHAQVDFSRDVLPILSDNCFHCHGPDETSRKAKLRLDTKEGALDAILPGKLKESELYQRIISEEPDQVMPTPKSNRKLTAKQKETLRKWIEEGAKWGKHWSFEPIRKDGFKHSTIDGFIREKLAGEKLQLADPATKEAWLRRVTFDLTGLPPTIEEIDLFTKESLPNAHEKVVDLLLASPRFGERMAADWLDIARFADTFGYQADRFWPVWPYRDWVINSFNRNQPYDEFVRDQIAGDLLPNATKEQILATSFNRLHMQNEEGGIVEEEFRVAYVNDRVTTFGTAFLGLTFECSRCHDHKYDPITQKDFYSLFAFFQNIDESGQTTHFTNAVPVPTLLLTDKKQEEQKQKLLAQVKQASEELEEKKLAAKTEFETWLANPKNKSITKPKPVAHFSFDAIQKNQLANSINGKLPANLHEQPKIVAGKVNNAISLDGENGVTFPGVGHFRKSDPFTVSIWVKVAELSPRAVILHHSRAPIDAGSRGYELLLESGKVAFGLHHMWPGNSLKVVSDQTIQPNEWTQLTITYNGTGNARAIAIYINGEAQKLTIVRDSLQKDITYNGSEPDLQLGFRFRDNGLKNSQVDELALYDRSLTNLEVLSLLGKSSEDAKMWQEYYTATVNESAMKAAGDLRKAHLEHDQFLLPIAEMMVMKELPKPKPAYILKRGNYDSLGEKVREETPNWLNAYPAQSPRNRLGLLDWLKDEQQPLFARVAVNRLWQQMFGSGLVETSDNFGTQGTVPTHPELLDFLASDFRKDYNIKRMLKQIALSAVYRQSSIPANPALSMEKDPLNHWLSRYPVRRLSAEMIRDNALTVSGLLVEKQGGPSVKPYQPDGLWDLAAGKPVYDRSKGDDLYRRSLYTFVKRTAPHPQMQTFDAADRSNCAVRRQSTSTPLQALALLNDPQIIEASRMMATKMDEKDIRKSISTVFRNTTSRDITEKELTILSKLLESQSSLFAAKPENAKKFLNVGEKKVQTDNPARLAAKTVLCLTILNHDEAINLR